MTVYLEMSIDDVKVLARVLEAKMGMPEGDPKTYERIAEYLESVIEEME